MNKPRPELHLPPHDVPAPRTAARLVALMLLSSLVLCFEPRGFAAEVLSKPERIEISPQEISLVGPRAFAQLVVTGRMVGGELRDITREAELRVPKFVKVDDGLVTPVANGEGAIEVVWGSWRESIKVAVRKFDEPAPVSFRRETLAVLTKQGCNGGSCHGKPNGRGALELSLNAFDPVADEKTLIRAPLLRFTHPLDANESLLLKKPLLVLPHGGGKRLKPSDTSYTILKQWIEEGCQADPPGAADCVKLEIFPNSDRVLRLDAANPAAGQQQIRVIAQLSDGTRQDVTRIASFSVSSDKVASVDDRGLVTGLDRGQTAVVARYLDDIVSTNIVFVREVPGFVWNNAPENNFVDQLTHQKLRQLQYLPSGDCDDATFFRRLSLDVRGLLPSVAETAEFLADTAPNKRAVWIDRFLESPEYARFWSLRMADLLRINKTKLSPERATAFSRWVFESVAENQPYDQFVRELLTSRGHTDENPAANFFRVTSDTNTVTETVAQLFMGSRVLCAQCHNHPYESWTQNNYYQIGAAFHEIDRKTVTAPAADKATDSKKKKDAKSDPRETEMTIEMSPGRTLANPRTGVTQLPWPVDVVRQKNEDKRITFALWLTAKGNPYFARVAVNRIWAHLFGRGLVEPIDDFRSSNPAVNPELLDALAADFENAGFDRRHTLRQILNSRTYQRSSETNAFNDTDDTLFSHTMTRMLSAEQLQDAIRQVCEGSDRLAALQSDWANTQKQLDDLLVLAGDEKDTKEIKEAAKRRDAARVRVETYFMTQQPFPQLTSFLTAFGQPPRETACACERRSETNLDQALQLMNSDLIRSQVSQASSRLEKLSDGAFIRELYLSALGREPQAAEREKLSAYLLNAAANRRAAMEDILWAVLNTNEFMFQH